MVAITLDEKKAICAKYPDALIVRTMKHDSKRHHYYMVETGAPMRYLNSLRGIERTKNKRKEV